MFRPLSVGAEEEDGCIFTYPVTIKRVPIPRQDLWGYVCGKLVTCNTRAEVMVPRSCSQSGVPTAEYAISRRDFLHSLICARLLTVRLIWSMLTEYRLKFCEFRDGPSAPPFKS